MSKIHLDILDKERQGVFQLLSQFGKFGYLGGGTALALQIAHRKSFDFDIFVHKPITTSLKAAVKDIFGEVDYYVNSRDQISFRTKNNINVTFLWYYFNHLFPLLPTDSLSLASVKDIAADKAHTIGRRAVWRDYIDFFFLLKEDWVTIEEVSVWAKKKFGGEFDEALFLQQLSYFKDIESAPIEFLEKSYATEDVKKFLEEKVEQHIKSLLKAPPIHNQ